MPARRLAAARWRRSRNGTTSPSRRQRIDCSGRTQRRSPSPHRIDLGQGKRAKASGRLDASMSRTWRPGCRIVAIQHPALLSSRCLDRRRRRPPSARRSPRRPRPARRPAAPVAPRSRSGWRTGRPRTTTPSRRGVAKLSICSNGRPASLSTALQQSPPARSRASPLQARRNLLGQQLQQQLSHGLARLPASQASAQRFGSSARQGRTRPI